MAAGSCTPFYFPHLLFIHLSCNLSSAADSLYFPFFALFIRRHKTFSESSLASHKNVFLLPIPYHLYSQIKQHLNYSASLPLAPLFRRFPICLLPHIRPRAWWHLYCNMYCNACRWPSLCIPGAALGPIVFTCSFPLWVRSIMLLVSHVGQFPWKWGR